MRVHTLNYHPEHAVIGTTAEGGKIVFQLFDGKHAEGESITIQLEASDVKEPKALGQTIFTSYGKGNTIGFALPADWKDCAVTALHYANMVVIVCTGTSAANAPVLYQQVLKAIRQRRLASLPAFYAVPLGETHNRKPAGQRRLQAA